MKFMARIDSQLHFINITIDIIFPLWPLDSSIRSIFEMGQL